MFTDHIKSYGLTNAPAVFQCFINKVIKDMIRRYVITYVDDILIYLL